MSARFAASQAIGHSMLALLLCVLAFLFAFEAKLAWYSPARGLYGQVSATKALPVDSPALVAHGTPPPAPLQNQVTFSVLAILMAVSLGASDAVQGRRPLFTRPSFFIAFYLLPPNYFRPPPAR
jgi:hypothetical protein